MGTGAGLDVLAPRPVPPGERLRELGRRLAAWSGALPAVLAGGLVLALAAAAGLRTEAETEAGYAREARRAFRAGDYPTARLCYARLAAAPGAGPEALWGLARSYEAMGDPARAAPLWDRLAPADAPGHPVAQVRRALTLLKSAGGPDGPRHVAAAERHLRRALEADPRSVDANALLGRVLLNSGRAAEAARALEAAAAERPDPEIRLTLARAYAADGRREPARREAERARRDAARRVEDAPDDLAARMQVTKAASLLGDHAGAAAVLREGLARTGDPRYRPVLAAVYAAWSDAEAARPSADPARPLTLLEEGLRADPTSAALLDRFGRTLRAGGPNADRARRALRDLLASGRGGTGAHFVLGFDAWLRGDIPAARVHLEQAARLDPKAPAVANNLAWFLAHGPDPDLPRALTFADLALDRQPNEPLYRGTRGVILARLGRWKDALPDLEAALAADPADPDLHRTLADAYDRLGDADLAASHRARASAPPKPAPAPAAPPTAPAP